ncbi:MAG: hypothetical protein FWF77_01050 [Defluviitaleaceae bacterium]|nr:hypothetical protein [Defluviitaleaceae bacterium]
MGNLLKFNPGSKNSIPVAIPPNRVYNELSLPYNNGEGGEVRVDMQKYIDRLDQDRRDSESRMEQSMKTLKAELREDRQQMEQRIEARVLEDRRLSEQREERMDKRFSESMNRIDASVAEVQTLKWWILGVCLATILGIAAMVITVVSG